MHHSKESYVWLTVLFQSNQINLFPLKTLSKSLKSLEPWKIAGINSGEKRYGDPVGYLGWLVVKKDRVCNVIENEIFVILKELFIASETKPVEIANLVIFISRISWSVENQWMEKELLDQIPSNQAAKAVSELIREVNAIQWPTSLIIRNRSNYSVSDWQTLYRYIDYYNDSNNPIEPLGMLIEIAGLNLISQELKLLSEIARAFLFKFPPIVNIDKLFDDENYLLDALDNKWTTSEFIIATFIDRVRFSKSLKLSDKIISWIMREAWDDSARKLMRVTYGSRSIGGKTEEYLRQELDSAMQSRFGKESIKHKETFKYIEWPKDIEAIAGWAISENGEISDLSNSTYNYIVKNFIFTRSKRIKFVADSVFHRSNRINFTPWFLNTFSPKAQYAIHLIGFSIIKASDEIFNDFIKCLTKDISMIKSLLFTSVGSFIGRQIAEELLLIILAIINVLNNSDKRIELITDTISDLIFPYVRITEREPWIWDYKRDKEFPIHEEKLSLLNHYLSDIEKKYPDCKLVSLWIEAATTQWPWMQDSNE